MGTLFKVLSFKNSSVPRLSYCILGVHWVHIGRVSGEVLLMKVGFHVYLMPWFAELCLNVNSNEDWHVGSSLCHSPRPQVPTVRLDSCPISPLLPQHLSVQTDKITAVALYILNVLCVCLS